MTIDNEARTSVPVWVRIYNIPYEAWNMEGIARIASYLGKPLDIDCYTEDMCMENKGRSAFARVLIEMSAAYNWEDSVEVHTWDIETEQKVKNKLRVEYAWTPSRCKECMVYGHNDSHCPRQPREEIKDTRGQSNTIIDEDGFTLVGKKPGGQRTNTTMNNQGGNSYNPKGAKQDKGQSKSHFGDSYVFPQWKKTGPGHHNVAHTIPVKRAFGSVKKILTRNNHEPKPPNTIDKLFESSKPVKSVHPQSMPIKTNNMFQGLSTEEEEEEEMEMENDIKVVELDPVGEEIRTAMEKKNLDPQASGGDLANNPQDSQ